MMFIDLELTDDQHKALSETRSADWFTRLKFRNATSPENPSWNRALRNNHEKKRALVGG